MRLLFDDVVLPLELPARLPRFVPQLDDLADVARLQAQLTWSAYAVGLRRVLSLKSLELYPRFERSAHETRSAFARNPG